MVDVSRRATRIGHKGKIIVEIKATKGLTEIDEAQTIHYLKATRMPVGLLVNFGGKKLEWKRYANTR